MKKFTQILILSIFTILMIGSFAKSAFADDPILDVHFQNEPQPLFNVLNFAPGQSSEANITIKNNDTTTRNAYIEATSVNNDDELGNEMMIEIFKNPSTEAFQTLAFSDFLISAPIHLSDIVASGSETYRLKVTFLEDAGDSYQGKTLGFDICVGFSGGNETCSKDIIVGPETNTTGGSSGSGSDVHRLIITKEEAPVTYLNANQTSGFAMIVWYTNIPATSQVVYRLSSYTSYTFDTSILPGLGYPRYTNEDMTKDYRHSILLTGLTPGQNYSYRVVSRASPATVSYEHQFTVPLPAQINNGLVLGASTENGTGSNTGGRQGSVLGASTENTGDETSAGNILGASAAPLSSNLLSLCFLLALLILLLIYLIWKLWLRRRYEKRGIPEEIIQNRFYLFFGGLSLLAVIVCLIFGIYCPLPVFIISTIVSACFYAYRKLRSK